MMDDPGSYQGKTGKARKADIWDFDELNGGNKGKLNAKTRGVFNHDNSEHLMLEGSESRIMFEIRQIKQNQVSLMRTLEAFKNEILANQKNIMSILDKNHKESLPSLMYSDKTSIEPNQEVHKEKNLKDLKRKLLIANLKILELQKSLSDKNKL